MTDLRHFIRCYDGVLAPPLCERIVALFEASPQRHIGPRGRPVGQRDTERNFNWVQMNTSDVAEFAAIDLEIVAAVNRHVDRYVGDTGYGLFPYGFEEFLIKRYRPSADPGAQDQFPAHVDISNANTMHRMLALVLYLNDVAEGGETAFLKLDLKVAPRSGRLLMFPPNFLYPHAGLPPRGATKYILGTYLTYIDPQSNSGRT
jgi:prolyl 4-hydroxylase